MFPNIAALAAAIAGGGDPDRGFLVADIRPNAAGTAMVDYSPYGWTVTELGAGALSYDTEKVTFDGTNWLRLDIDPALLHLYNASEKLTLEITMSVATGGTLQRFVGARQDSAGGNHNWIHSITTGNVIETIINNSASIFNSAQTITPGVEFDFKWLVDGANKLVLVDNEPAGSADYNNTAWTNIPSEYLYIGAFASAGSNPLTSGSYIKRVRIYRGILKHDIAVPAIGLTDPSGDSNVEIQLDFEGSITDRSDNAYSFTGGAVDTNNPKFGSGNMVATATGGSGAQTTLNSGYGTGDYGFEGWFSPADEAVAYRLMVRIGHTWLYRYGNILQIWEANSTLKVFTNTPVLKQDTYRHYYYAKKNGIGILWVNGRICLFWADTINNTGTVFIVSSSSEFYGDIDDVRLTNSGTVYLPTLMRDETVYDTPSAESGANWFASTVFIGSGSAKSVAFTSFTPSSGSMAFVKNRTDTTPYAQRVFDTDRGATKEIYTSATTAETTDANGLTSFDGDGVTFGTSAGVNDSGDTITLEAFRASLSESITVDSQSLTLKHSGKGFGMIEIDRALGGASASIAVDFTAAGFASAPMYFVKNLDSAANWAVWHPGLTSGYYIVLNSSAAEINTSAANVFGNNSSFVAPTATTLTLGNSSLVGGSGVDRILVIAMGERSTDPAQNYIKLLDFAHTSGQTSYAECGWQPAWSVCKMRDAGSTDWVTRQTKRGTGLATLLNSGVAEATDFGGHGPFGIELNGTYAATGNIIGLAVRGN